MLPKHMPLAARKELSRKLHAAKAKKRLALGVDAETLRWRAMHPWTTFSDKFGPEIERIEAMNETPQIGHAAWSPDYKSITKPTGTYFGESPHAMKVHAKLEALSARVESASAIITELLARTAKTESPECDEAVAAAMAWLHDHK